MQSTVMKSFLLSDSVVPIKSVPEVLTQLEKAYGKRMLARILRCKPDLLKRSKKYTKILLTERQLSKLNTLIFIERLVCAEKPPTEEERNHSVA